MSVVLDDPSVPNSYDGVSDPSGPNVPLSLLVAMLLVVPRVVAMWRFDSDG